MSFSANLKLVEEAVQCLKKNVTLQNDIIPLIQSSTFDDENKTEEYIAKFGEERMLEITDFIQYMKKVYKLTLAKKIENLSSKGTKDLIGRALVNKEMEITKGLIFSSLGINGVYLQDTDSCSYIIAHILKNKCKSLLYKIKLEGVNEDGGKFICRIIVVGQINAKMQISAKIKNTDPAKFFRLLPDHCVYVNSLTGSFGKANEIWSKENEGKFFKKFRIASLSPEVEEIDPIKTAKLYAVLYEKAQQIGDELREILGQNYKRNQQISDNKEIEKYVDNRLTSSYIDYPASSDFKKNNLNNLLENVNAADPEKIFQVIKNSVPKSLENLMSFAESGDIESICELGIAFYRGNQGLTENKLLGLGLIQKAANQGYEPAKQFLAVQKTPDVDLNKAFSEKNKLLEILKTKNNPSNDEGFKKLLDSKLMTQESKNEIFQIIVEEQHVLALVNICKMPCFSKEREKTLLLAIEFKKPISIKTIFSQLYKTKEDLLQELINNPHDKIVDLVKEKIVAENKEILSEETLLYILKQQGPENKKIAAFEFIINKMAEVAKDKLNNCLYSVLHKNIEIPSIMKVVRKMLDNGVLKGKLSEEHHKSLSELVKPAQSLISPKISGFDESSSSSSFGNVSGVTSPAMNPYSYFASMSPEQSPPEIKSKIQALQQRSSTPVAVQELVSAQPAVVASWFEQQLISNDPRMKEVDSQDEKQKGFLFVHEKIVEELKLALPAKDPFGDRIKFAKPKKSKKDKSANHGLKLLEPSGLPGIKVNISIAGKDYPIDNDKVLFYEYVIPNVAMRPLIAKINAEEGQGSLYLVIGILPKGIHGKIVRAVNENLEIVPSLSLQTIQTPSMRLTS